MSVEAPVKRNAEIIADELAESLLNHPVQEKLFEPKPVDASFALASLKRLQEANPDNLIIEAALVEDYRLMASFLGAGFHRSQYEDVMFRKNDPDEVGRMVIGLWGQTGRVKPTSPTSNRMRDEVFHNEMFTSAVSSTRYDMSGYFITSEEDLRTMFAYDYDNLAACRALDFELLYEGED